MSSGLDDDTSGRVDADAGTATECWAGDHRKSLLLTSAVLLGAVVVVWALARRGPLPGEQDLTLAIQRTLLRPDTVQTADFVEGLSTPAVAVATVLAGAGIALRRIGPRAALLVLAAAGVIVVTDAVKAILGPTVAFTDVTGRIADNNFPSGHASYVAAVFGAFAWLAWLRRTPELSAIAVVLIVAMGPARVARGAHVPSDVLGGYLLGAAWLLGCVAACVPTGTRRASRTAP